MKSNIYVGLALLLISTNAAAEDLGSFEKYSDCKDAAFRILQDRCPAPYSSTEYGSENTGSYDIETTFYDGKFSYSPSIRADGKLELKYVGTGKLEVFDSRDLSIQKRDVRTEVVAIFDIPTKSCALPKGWETYLMEIRAGKWSSPKL